jgi:hypothetical protein
LLTAASWHVTSQQHARRNALRGSAELALARQERVEVEEFLAALAPHPARVVGINGRAGAR